MSDNRDRIRVHVGEMLAVSKHVHEALERQLGDDDLAAFSDAHQVVSRAESVLRRQHAELETLIAGLDERLLDKVKQGVTSLLGELAGLYDKIRGDQVSRMLRDDYTALSLTSAAYTMLHATGLAYRHGATADVALRHLKDLTPLVVELSEVLPGVVAQELAREHDGVDATAGAVARRNTQEAWKPRHTGQGDGGEAKSPAGAGVPVGTPVGSQVS
ncbi:MAG TPA: hypothetical protein VHQ65_10640 [Thermoanaerobaculia bacterium]|nr:hypothetical protein [Thermoanaerobaculia bacterium]